MTKFTQTHPRSTNWMAFMGYVMLLVEVLIK